MRDLPASPRQGSPDLLPRRLSDELGDFSFSSDEYDDQEDAGEDEDESYTAVGTPTSSRKSSHSLGSVFDEVNAYKQLQDTTSESERTEKKNNSRPSTAVSMPPFRRASTCPVLPEDFISSAAEEVVKIMPDQADFMKRMVEGWREIQRRSSVSTMSHITSPASAVSPSAVASPKRPHTAPSPLHPPQMCFSSFPQTVPERDEPDSLTESVEGAVSGMVEMLETVEETLEELRDLAKQQAGAAIASTSASMAEQDAKFAAVNKCIDTIGRVCERTPEPDSDAPFHRERLDERCVQALVQICEMFARESVEQDHHWLGPGFMAEESEDDDVEYEGEDEDEGEGESESDRQSDWVDEDDDDEGEEPPIDSEPTEYESGDFLGGQPTVETDKTLPPSPPSRRSATPTRPKTAEPRIEGPDTPRRRARLVREAKAELEALFSEWAAPQNSFEERHSRIVYATEAYHLRLADMKSAHEFEFKWKDELKAYDKAMENRGHFGPRVWEVIELALPLAQFWLTMLLLVADYFRLDRWIEKPDSFLMFLTIWVASVVLLARFKEVGDRKHLYETMLPLEAREMRKKHERELVLLKAAHDRAIQRMYLPEQ
ncbi:hypothetical protein CSUB01_05592 [Colletotrichum sublineola]|uniref:Uncharacterized protein n=1 Tax=Colletotrichum sublineola TaxID=1173701 RepID=A0A066XIZ8_COLSU|nr:hypothetical protein CSUB01_05592 [Colletotrichum sublineola]